MHEWIGAERRRVNLQYLEAIVEIPSKENSLFHFFLITRGRSSVVGDGRRGRQHASGEILNKLILLVLSVGVFVSQPSLECSL